ncbi:hypothetical protein ACK8OR_07545 [Jannaschia sp. KMU-145]|uniref:hypothetical protein n=1 Tax=Jannaschia halovivens TaxID=3388667 RepID=UPI00396AF4C0
MRRIAVAALALVLGAGVTLTVIRSEIIEVWTERPRPLSRAASETEATPDEVAAALRAAGLNRSPILGDTGIATHLRRLERGQVSAAALLSYAADLSELRRISTTRGAPIPSAFWDVETPALTRDGWTPFAIVAHLSEPEGRPYLDLLAQAYARFHAFRTGPEDADTALAAAFDILDLAHAYIRAVPPERRLQHGPKLESVEAATLMAWQTLVAGTTRQVPFLRRPAFDHGFVGRFNVKTIYQYDTATPMSVGAVWGVSGFAPRYVGPPENDNQVEHLTITALLQVVAGTPVAALDALELEKVATGASSRAEARADIALNGAVHEQFAIALHEDFAGAADALHSVLSD